MTKRDFNSETFYVKNVSCNTFGEIYPFSQEDSFLKEREVSRWEVNWLRTRDVRKPS